MHLLLLVVAAIAIAAIGSARFALAFGLLIIAIPLTVRGTAHAVSGVEVSFGDAARAVTYSAGFALVFIAALLSAGRGDATLGPLLLAALLAAYTGGFVLALRTPFVPSMLIATISTMVSAALIWLAGRAF